MDSAYLCRAISVFSSKLMDSAYLCRAISVFSSKLMDSAYLRREEVHAVARKVLGDLEELALCLRWGVPCLGLVQLHQLHLICVRLE